MSEPSAQRIVWFAVVILMVAGLLPIFLLPIFLSHYSQRESWAITALLVLWVLAVAIATMVILRRVLPAGATAVSAAPRSRGEKILNWTALLLSLLVFYAAVVTRRPIPLWLWVCSVAITVLVTLLTLRSLSRDQRGRTAGIVYGMVVGLSVLFPVVAVPRRFHFTASLLIGLVVTAMLVLEINTAARQRKAPAAH